MPELNDHLDAIGKELAGLLSVDDKSTAATVTMSPEDFIKYATEQIALAKSDTDPKPRLAALVEVVDLAKAYSWEDGGGMAVSVYNGPEAVQNTSREAESIADHPGKGLGVPGPEATPASGAFESASGPTGPASNTAKPEARIMPPAFPQSEPAASGEGWMAKAATVLKSVDGGEALLAELSAMLGAEAMPGDGDDAKKEAAVAKGDDGWPADLATEAFLEEKPEVRTEEDFGTDPGGLARGKVIKG